MTSQAIIKISQTILNNIIICKLRRQQQVMENVWYVSQLCCLDR